MKKITIKLPLKNETFDGYSNIKFMEYDIDMNNKDNSEIIVKNWLKKEGIEFWPFEIISITDYTKSNCSSMF